jgi:chromosome segregation ATPase
MEQSEFLDQKIQSKTNALMSLTAQLNAKKDDFDKRIKELDEALEKRKHEFFEKLTEIEKGLQKPEESISSIREQLVSKEKDLKFWQEKIDKEWQRVSEIEKVINSKEALFDQEEQELTKAWSTYISALQSTIFMEKDSLKKRAQVVEDRSKLLDDRQNRLNDQIRTFKAAQKEIDGKSEH